MEERVAKPRSSRDSRSRGGIAVEFAFVAPVLFTLMAGAFELSRVVFNYQVVLAAAYEGARAASQIDPAALGKGCFGATGLDHDSAASGSPERMVMDRVEYLLNLQGDSISLEAPQISAEIVKSGNGQALSASESCSSASKENTIAIRIRGNYRPAILSFLSVPLSVESRAYLLANNQTFATATNPTPKGSCGGVSSGSYTASNSNNLAMEEAGGGMQIAAVTSGPAEMSTLCNFSSHNPATGIEISE
jgi:hypothetical protein